jgi:hypothetical protein
LNDCEPDFKNFISKSYKNIGRIKAIHKPIRINSSTSQSNAFFIVIESKRKVFTDWQSKVAQMKLFQEYISEAKKENIESNPSFTTEYKEKIEKYELKRVDPTLYLYFGGEKVLASSQFINKELVEKANDLSKSSPPIQIGFIVPDGERYDVYNLQDNQFIKSNNIRVNSVTTKGITLSGKSDNIGGKIKCKSKRNYQT